MVIEVASALAVVHRILNGRNSRPILAMILRALEARAYGNTPGARVLRLVRLV